MAQDQQQSAMYYMQLLQQGVPNAQAFKMAFPNGIQTAQQKAKEQAGAQQGAALGQVGGMLVGALGAKYAISHIPQLFGFSAPEAASTAAATGSAAIGDAASLTASTSLAPGAATAGAGEGLTLGAAGTGDSLTAALGSTGAADAGTSAFSLGGIGTTGNAFLPIAGAAGLYDIFANDRSGLSGGLEGAASGAAIGSYFGPVGIGAGALLGGLYGAFGNHETTREHEAKNTSQLAKMGSDNPAWQQYVAGMRQQYTAPPPDPSMPFGDSKGNKYKTWQDYKNAGLDAANLTGVYGNMKTFGPDWANYTEEQRQAVTQGLIDHNLYDSKKGDVIITDAQKAQQIRDQILGGQYKPPAQVAPQQPQFPQGSPAFQKAQVKQNGAFGNQLIAAMSQ